MSFINPPHSPFSKGGSRFFLILSLFLISSICFASQELIIEPDMGRAPIIHSIKNANTKVDLVMYGFTDLSFLDALVYAKQHNKNVRVLLQRYPYLTKEENISAIHNLNSYSIPLRWPNEQFKLTHQKTLIIDDSKAIVMTFNFTRSTFSKERNFALVTTNQDEVNEIKNTFNGDWTHQLVIHKNINLVWSPDNSREKILSLIQDAEFNIDMYAAGLSDYKVIGALAKAAKSGVNVRILTTTFKNDNHHINRKFEFLAKSGVNIHYSKEYIIHAKVLVIDNKVAILGSINFTKPSIDNNRELSIITKDPIIISKLENTFKKDWQYSNSDIVTPRLNSSSHNMFKILSYVVPRLVHEIHAIL